MKKIIIATVSTLATATLATISARKKTRIDNLKTRIHGTADSCSKNTRYAEMCVESKWLSTDELTNFHDRLKSLNMKVDSLFAKAMKISDESELHRIQEEMESILQEILQIKNETFRLVLARQSKGYDDFLQSFKN